MTSAEGLVRRLGVGVQQRCRVGRPMARNVRMSGARPRSPSPASPDISGTMAAARPPSALLASQPAQNPHPLCTHGGPRFSHWAQADLNAAAGVHYRPARCLGARRGGPESVSRVGEELDGADAERREDKEDHHRDDHCLSASNHSSG